MSNEDKALTHDQGRMVVAQGQRQMTRAEAIETALDPRTQVDMIIAAGQEFDRLTHYALSLTDSRHWDNMQGAPRLNKVGAHMIAKKVGLRVRTFGSVLMESGKDANGPYFVYQCTGQISHPLSPSTIDCQGTCDSRNPFHTTRYEDVFGADGNRVFEQKTYYDKKLKRRVTRDLPKRERISLQAHQVQKAFISQQAQTLCKVKGISEFLGLERLSWDEIEQATQARQDLSTSIHFEDKSDKAKKGKRDEQRDKEQPPEDPTATRRPEDEPASGKQRSLVWKGFQEVRGWTDELPGNAAEVFYDWVAEVVGSDYRDRSKWTVGVVHALLKELEEPRERKADADDGFTGVPF